MFNFLISSNRARRRHQETTTRTGSRSTGGKRPPVTRRLPLGSHHKGTHLPFWKRWLHRWLGGSGPS